MRQQAPSTERNREPIRAVLAKHLPPDARVLELASGSGEHAVYLANALGVSHWQPSDPDARAQASIDAWRTEAPAVAAALPLDVEQGAWPPLTVDAVVCINMIHISPWSATLALMRRARSVLTTEGLLFLYGPYRRTAVETAPSNEAFDASLKARNPAWGLRDLAAVVDAARAEDLILVEVVEMPANNVSVIFTRRAAPRDAAGVTR